MKIKIEHVNYSRAVTYLRHLKYYNMDAFYKLADKIEKVYLKEKNKYYKKRRDN